MKISKDRVENLIWSLGKALESVESEVEKFAGTDITYGDTSYPAHPYCAGMSEAYSHAISELRGLIESEGRRVEHLAEIVAWAKSRHNLQTDLSEYRAFLKKASQILGKDLTSVYLTRKEVWVMLLGALNEAPPSEINQIKNIILP